MINHNPDISIITMNGNALNVQIKGRDFSDRIKRSNYMIYKTNTLSIKTACKSMSK